MEITLQTDNEKIVITDVLQKLTLSELKKMAVEKGLKYNEKNVSKKQLIKQLENV
jgi:hypothetical protein